MDRFVLALDRALRAATGVASSVKNDARKNPAAAVAEGHLDDGERRHSAGLMRVNHVGEVCAQALYESQGQFSSNAALREQFAQAGREEEDHLAWTVERLRELGSRPSLLNPLWYAGSYALGVMAAHAGDAFSLGFVVETERQVEVHLASHLAMLPTQDAKSRAIVEQMRVDEIEHGQAAQAMGAAETPWPVRKLMQAMAKVMTTTAYYV
jgi:ubiquinone biosynthesis monooxygenase Coq7